ncbi:hypothetical protein [Ahrensia sp. 13_GOM-1096m]|uniref:hypothetical protein n=1 Tax=Ahrensia sp. 13_GOM-1096m TaxID=1380380 RepID=UPI0004790480|nr:hypothetical protein [Ahrensia sp. 13_GOM-1096m]
MKNFFARFALLSAVLFLQNDARADTGGYMLLAPSSEVTLDIHGVCKTIRNLTGEVEAYIPINTKEVWAGMDSRSDQNDNPIIEIKSCKN